LIVKVVNFSAKPLNLAVALGGIENPDSEAKGWIMEGSPATVNSLEEPEKIAPRPITLRGVGKNFTHEFPAYSVTVFRVGQGGM
jgi:alpha-L-arabinofuranosidase